MPFIKSLDISQKSSNFFLNLRVYPPKKLDLRVARKSTTSPLPDEHTTKFSCCRNRLGIPLVCSTSLMALLIRSIGGLSKCFYQGLWLADLNTDVIGQSINRHGGLPRNSLLTWLFLFPFLHDFCMDFHTDSRSHGRSYEAWDIR